MRLTRRIAYSTLIFLNLYANIESAIDPVVQKEFVLQKEFSIADYWHEGMTWKRFLRIRKGLQRLELAKYFDKIAQQEVVKEAGLEVVKTFVASREKVPFTEIISDLESYVAKASHLSNSDGVIIVKNGINMLTGKPITPEQVQKSIFESFEQKPSWRESWVLHNLPPGFLIQEYVPLRIEAKIQTIWGKAVMGLWVGIESKSRTVDHWGRYDRNGKQLGDSKTTPEWWPKAIAAAEQLAKSIGADALRVDFLVKEGGILLVNELGFCPGNDWTDKGNTIEKLLNDGYRKICKDKNKDIDSDSR